MTQRIAVSLFLATIMAWTLMFGYVFFHLP
jgi:hypothetical protein